MNILENEKKREKDLQPERESQRPRINRKNKGWQSMRHGLKWQNFLRRFLNLLQLMYYSSNNFNNNCLIKVHIFREVKKWKIGMIWKSI